MTFNFTVGKQSITLTEPEARDLYGQLEQLFNPQRGEHTDTPAYDWRQLGVTEWPMRGELRWTCHV